MIMSCTVTTAQARSSRRGGAADAMSCDANTIGGLCDRAVVRAVVVCEKKPAMLAAAAAAAALAQLQRRRGGGAARKQNGKIVQTRTGRAITVRT
jgi:hypothetical protein